MRALNETGMGKMAKIFDQIVMETTEDRHIHCVSKTGPLGLMRHNFTNSQHLLIIFGMGVDPILKFQFITVKVFTARCICIAQTMLSQDVRVCLSVRLSVRLSHAGIES